jgi:anti-sigma factor RsiW
MQDLLHGYVDGELDLVHTLEVEQHLQACSACVRSCAEIRELRAALQAGLPRFTPPEDLRARVRAALRRADRDRRPALGRWRWGTLAAALAVLALGAAGLAFLLGAPAAHDRLVQEVVASHVRSQMVATHLLDVESSDRHTVKPWFHGKLDFAPAVRDLSEHGFALAGGRLDYVNGRAVAALVYRRRQHVINLLVWPGRAEEAGPRSEMKQGYHVVHWRQGGMSWWAVSDLNPAELAEFVRLIQARE